MKLILEYKPLQNPYKDEPYTNNEKWGKIDILLLNNKNVVVKSLLSIEWDISVFVEWIVSNEHFLLNEQLPIKNEDDSIAKVLSDFYDQIEIDFLDDILLDNVFAYRNKHGFRFGLRGIEICDIYLGNRGDKMTISCYDENDKWNYFIETEPFFRMARRLHNSFEIF